MVGVRLLYPGSEVRPGRPAPMATTPLDRLTFAQGGLCFFCREPLPRSEASVEHLVATANGGTNSDDNCVVCCKSLNRLFGSLPLKEKIRIVLNQNGSFKCPNAQARSKVARSPLQAAQPAKAPPSEDPLRRVIANLRQRKDKLPRTIKTLTSTIVSLRIPADQAQGLVQKLLDTGVITVAGTRLQYELKRAG
jgi:hypothetical protein